jgi:hypothetical protein
VPFFDAKVLEQLTGLPLKPEHEAQIFDGLPELSYTPATREEEAAIFADIENIIANKKFRVVGDGDDHAVWEKGWGEVAAALANATTVSIETLKPQYYHNDVPLRMLRGYVKPHSDYFEYYVGIAVRRQVLLTYLNDPHRLVELGCGTGMNLLIAAALFPNAELGGSDWVQPTLDILKTMGRVLGRDIDATLYNMLTGAGFDDVKIDSSTDVLTFHALEQLGSSSGAVIDGLIKRRPRRVMHMEPIVDFYDRSLPIDDIGARYHISRRYLTGLYPLLKEREAAGQISIVAEHRVPLGNLYHEAYSYVIWTPA